MHLCVNQINKALFAVPLARRFRPQNRFTLPGSPTMSYGTIVESQQVEEETTSYYDPSLYYPVHNNQNFHGRYTTALKLGYGGYSTVWLCYDEMSHSYKTLKVGTRRKVNEQSQEIRVLNHLKDTGLSHDGRYCVRRACDYFEIEVPGGHHPCFVYEPLGVSLLDYVELQPSKRLDMPTVKWITTYLLLAIDYLHESGVIHTDIKLNNILCTLPNDGEAILRRLVDAEHQHPSPRKIVDDRRTIYTSRVPEYGNVLGYPILCDPGMSVFGQEEYNGVIQPIPYRAPEIILRMKWKSSVDIWNLGVVIWELLCGEHLFGRENEQDSLTKMITYLGPPPTKFVSASCLRSMDFDDHGCWNKSTLQSIPLKDRLEGDGDIDLFLDFILSMLAWEPEKRKTAAELRHHPWLRPV